MNGGSGLEGPLIKTEGITKLYGRVKALKGVSLEIERSELFGLIGPNGAGKTTLFKVLLGLLPPTSGRVVVKGVDVSMEWPRRLRMLTGYLPENVAFYPHLTGIETLDFYARIKGCRRDEIPIIVERVGLTMDVMGRKVGEYSKGMRQRLGLAQALLGKPSILFLDEPTSGLDPEGIEDFYRILLGLKEEGVTIIMTSHILREIQDRVDRLGIIAGGSLLAVGTIKDLKKKLALKCSISLTIMSGRDEIERLASKEGGMDFTYKDGVLIFTCNHKEKMRVIKAVMERKDDIIDMDVIEPSLEDVFLRYVGGGV